MVFLKCSIMIKSIDGVHEEANMFYQLLTGILDKQCPKVKHIGKSCMLYPSTAQINALQQAVI